MQRSRPRQSRIEARREKFLSGALSAFLHKGYERTTLDDIIERSGGSKATLYSLFRNKGEILFAILQRAASDIAGGDAAEALPGDADRLNEMLLVIARRIVSSVLKSDIIGLYKLAVEAAQHTPAIGALYFEGGPLKAQGDFAGLLVRLDAKGLLRIEDPELAASFFFGMLLDKRHLAMSLGQAAAPNKKERERLAKEAVRVFLDAYRGR